MITFSALHLIDLVIQLYYLYFFTQYIINPPSKWSAGGTPKPSLCSTLIVIYALSRVLRDHWTIALPYYIVILGFYVALPSVPQAGNYSYSYLVLSYCINIIQLLLPIPASPSLLLPNTSFLTLSSIAQDHITRIFIPAIIYFTPAFTLPFIVLIFTSVNIPSVAFLNDMLATVPESARIGLQLILFLLIGFLISVITSMVLSSSVLPPDGVNSTRVPCQWKNYGPRFDFLTRQYLYAAILDYSSARFYPAPFNLIYIVFIRIPFLAGFFIVYLLFPLR